MDKIKEKKGSTIIELVVSFLVLITLVGMFFQIVQTSYRMINKSKSIRTNVEDFYSRYYEHEAGVIDDSAAQISKEEAAATLYLTDSSGIECSLKNDKIIHIQDNKSNVSIYAFKTPD